MEDDTDPRKGVFAEALIDSKLRSKGEESQGQE
jgi:hypothetical protein